MNMTPALRKLTLTTHVTASVGWCGALEVFLAATNTPGWVKGVAAAVVLLVIMLALMLLGGGHGPGAHG